MTEGPYKLPEGWRWVRLGEVASEIQSGFAFRKKGAKDGDILHIRPYNISSDGELLLEQQFKIPTNALPEGWSYLHPGDVLFNNTNSVELLGKTAIVKTKMLAAFSNHITRIRTCLDKCKGEWLALVLRTLWQQGFFAQHCNKWVGQAGYNTKMLKKTLIPLPPLNEQQRIVAKVEALLEQVREARILRQKACEDTDCLWQAVLADTFPRPGADLPPTWRWVRLGEVASRPQYGYTKAATMHPIGPKLVRITDITAGEIDWERVPYCECDSEKLEKYRLSPGDVLFARSGSVGATILIRETPYVAVFASYLIRVRFRESILSKFANLLLKAPICQRQLVPQGAAQKNINARLIERILIPLPPLNEQQRIVAHLEAVQKEIESLKESQAKFEIELQCLEQSILDSAFGGEL